MALTDCEGSSYTDSMCELLFDSCNFLIFALLLCKMITVVVAKTTILVINTTARELVAIIHTVLVHVPALFLSCDVEVCILTGSLLKPTRFLQATACIANLHFSWYISTSDIGVVGGSGAAATV